MITYICMYHLPWVLLAQRVLCMSVVHFRGPLMNFERPPVFKEKQGASIYFYLKTFAHQHWYWNMTQHAPLSFSGLVHVWRGEGGECCWATFCTNSMMIDASYHNSWIPIESHPLWKSSPFLIHSMPRTIGISPFVLVFLEGPLFSCLLAVLDASSIIVFSLSLIL